MNDPLVSFNKIMYFKANYKKDLWEVFEINEITYAFLYVSVLFKIKMPHIF